METTNRRKRSLQMIFQYKKIYPINILYKSSINIIFWEKTGEEHTHFVSITSWQQKLRWESVKSFLTKLINEKPRDAQKVLYNLRYIFFYDHCHNFFILLTAHIFIKVFQKQKGFLVNNKYVQRVPPSSNTFSCPLSCVSSQEDKKI